MLPRRHELRHAERDTVVELEPKVSELLVVLAQARGDVVSRDELHASLWPGTFVTDKALTGAMAKLRKALDDDAASPRYVATIPKRGYRLVAEVATVPEGSAGTPRAVVPGPDDGGTRRWRVAAAVVAVVLVGGTAWSRLAERPDPGPTAIRVTSESGFELHPAISPGGETVAYSAAGGEDNWDIYLRRPGSSALRLTEHPHRDVRPIWSPDGSQIAFIRFDDTSCRLMVMPALGGEAVPLSWCSEFLPAEVFWGPKPAWSPDGRFIAWPFRRSARESVAIFFVDVATGASRRVTNPPAWHADGSPAISPDGRWLAFSRRGYGAREVWAVPLDEGGEAAGPVQQVTFEARAMMGHAWLANSREILVSSQRDGTFSLWAHPVDGGVPRWVPAPGENLKEPSLSAGDGRLVYEDWSYDENIWRADLGAGAIVTTSSGATLASAETAAEQWVASSLWDSEPVYSPNGSEIAFVSNRSGSFEVWIVAADASDPRMVTRLQTGAIGPIAWHPDGASLFFEARPEGVGQVFRVPAAGGAVTQITDGPNENVLPAIAPGGARLWFSSNRSGSWAIWSAPLDAQGGIGSPEQATADGAYGGRLTDDRQTLLFTKHGEAGLWAQPAEGGAAQRVIDGLRASDFGNWTVHGRHVVYVQRTRGREVEIATLDLDTGRTRTLFTPAGTILASRRGLSISPDGRYLLYTQMDDASSDLVVVENLFR